MVPTANSPIEVLNQTRARLMERFLSGNEPNFLELHAQAFDEYFRNSFERSSVGPRMRINQNPYAFIALGGYGRREQCFHSDVDILVLFKKKVPTETKELVRELFYPLWDIGLEVGYATRNIKECVSMCAGDYEVLTSLLDARFLCGMSYLYSDLMETIHDKLLRKHKRSFVKWMREQTEERHTKYGDSSYRLEPNLKEGLGGLRDYHATLWLGQTLYDVRTIREFVYADLLTHQEYEELTAALQFIWKVRNWLHQFNGRKADQLYFEHQIKLAEALKYPKENDEEPVEKFLGVLHGHMELVKQQYLMFLQRIAPRFNGLKLVKPRKRLSVTGLYLDQDKIEFDSAEAILEKPHLLVKIFEQSSRLDLPLSIEAKRLAREFTYLIDDDFRSDPSVVKALSRILLGPPRTFNVLNEMFYTGVMPALIPELNTIIDRVQYDAYHVYPVDKHSLRAVQFLKQFSEAEGNHEHELFGKLFRSLKRPHALLWATLLHDIGKGTRSPDHAESGAEIVKTIFNRMNFPKQDIDTISWLIREHLLLVHTSHGRDINDEVEVIQCARRMPDIEHLNMLYLLTVCDSMATGPKAWNDWADILYRELFFKVSRILESGEFSTPKARESFEKKKEAVLSAGGPDSEDLARAFEFISPRYLLYTSVKDILRHIELYNRLGALPVVWDIKKHARASYRIVTICAHDRPGLISKISGVFTLNNLDILNLRAYTWRNRVALDIFIVKAPIDTYREEEIWRRAEGQLVKALGGELDLGAALSEKFRNQMFTKEQIGLRKPRVVIDNDASAFFTIIEAYAHDYPGLLFRLSDALFRCNLDVRVAKIGTKVDQAFDVFYVRDLEGQKVTDERQMAAIREALAPVINANTPVIKDQIPAAS